MYRAFCSSKYYLQYGTFVQEVYLKPGEYSVIEDRISDYMLQTYNKSTYVLKTLNTSHSQSPVRATDIEHNTPTKGKLAYVHVNVLNNRQRELLKRCK